MNELATVFIEGNGGYVLMDGKKLPITGFYDEDGELTDDPDEYAFCECGPDEEDFYYDVEIYPEETVH